MNAIIVTLAITLALVLIGMAGMAVKTILGHGAMRRHCAGIDPYSGKHNGCACNIQTKDACHQSNNHPYQPLTVNDALMEEINT